MAEAKFVLYVRKFIKNPLLARKQCSIELIHPEMANLSKAQIKEKLAKVLKSKDECISIFGLQTKFGGGKTTGFALVYDSFDAKKKYDQKTLRKRDGLVEKKKVGRKQYKEIKRRIKKIRGVRKHKVSGDKKKKK
eukprot:CAMPEP_0116877170 /NCGR_PEP_ID=MMETSP0463-20121206/8984_1 /TAXON_ID=181622 /ORGANISM="Strombidinopsis sp, Strain SopsisLIS2011" /LENGTH=134 /DNA_ID=CAMNT_0004524251 /DNA_START=38 /DNA_END=442 /DNA_ORIENTATION=+